MIIIKILKVKILKIKEVTEILKNLLTVILTLKSNELHLRLIKL